MDLLDNDIKITPYHQVEKEVKNLGFCLTHRVAGDGLNGYYYAGKRFDGKLKWVYVGASYQPAQKKIIAWLKKHQPDYLAKLNDQADVFLEEEQKTSLYDKIYALENRVSQLEEKNKELSLAVKKMTKSTKKRKSK